MECDHVIVGEHFKNNQKYQYLYGNAGDIQRYWKHEESLIEKETIRQSFLDNIYGDKDSFASMHGVLISIPDDSCTYEKVYNKDLILKFSESVQKIFAFTDALVIPNGQSGILTTLVGKAVGFIRDAEKFSEKRLNVATVGILHAVDIFKPGKDLEMKENILDTANGSLIAIRDGASLDITAIQILLQKDPRTPTNETTPLVIVVYGGGLQTLEQIKLAYLKKIPFVIVKGSGGIADVLSVIHERLNGTGATIKSKEKILPDKPLLRSIFTLENDLVEAISILSDLIDNMKSQTDLCQVCQNLDFLGVHITRAAFLDSDMDKMVSSRVLGCRIIERGPQLFCDLLCDYEYQKENLGEKLLARLTWEDILYLYGRLPDEAQIKSSLQSKNLSFYGINVVFKKLLQRIQSDILKLIELPTSKLQNDKGKVMRSVHHTEQKRIPIVNGLDPHQPTHLDIFIWYLVSEQTSVTKSFWVRSKQMTIRECFVACALLDGLKHIVYGSKTLEKIQLTSEKFISHATNLLNECYQYHDFSVEVLSGIHAMEDCNNIEETEERTNDPKLFTELLLLMKPEDYLSVAYKLHKTEFFRHRSVRDVLHRKWIGECTSKKLQLLKLFLPLLILAIFPFALPVALVVNINFVTRVVSDFNVPVIKCIFLYIPYIIFVLLLSYELLVDFSSGLSGLDYYLILYIVCYTTEEIRQMIPSSGIKYVTYLRSHFRWWNLNDICCIVCFVVGIVLKLVEILDISRVALAIDVTLFTLRVLALTAVSRNLGPKLVMIGKMFVDDLIPFMVILFVFILGFSIADYSLLYHDSTLSYGLVERVLMSGYWILYGENNLEEFDGSQCESSTSPCPSALGVAVVPYIRGFFALLSVVLLLNVLIAMFNDTYRKVQDVSYMHWIYNYNELITEYESKPLLPPPFLVLIIPHTIVYCIGWILKCKCRKSDDIGDSVNSKNGDFVKGLLLIKTVYLTSGDPYDKYRKQAGFKKKLHQFERKVKEMYRKRLIQKKVKRNENSEESTKNRLASLELEVSKQSKEIEALRRDLAFLLNDY